MIQITYSCIVFLPGHLLRIRCVIDRSIIYPETGSTGLYAADIEQIYGSSILTSVEMIGPPEVWDWVSVCIR